MQQHLAVVVSCCIAAGGCESRVPLDDVPVRGGSWEQQTLVREELAAFEQWIGSGRIELSGVEFVESSRGSAVYNRQTGRIRLEDTILLRDLRSVVRHELCHAVDYQENLLNRPVAIFDELASSIDDDAEHVLHGKLGPGGRRMKRGEAMANLCQQAPLRTALMEAPCPDESDEFERAARWIREHVWQGEPDVSMEDPWAASADEVLWLASTERPIRVLEIIGSRQADRALMFVGRDGEPTVDVSVDLADGSEVPLIEDFDFESAEGAFPSMPTGLDALPMFRPTDIGEVPIVGREDQAVARVESLPLLYFDVPWFSPHVIAFDDGRWSVVEGACPGESSSVFLANSRFYVGWADGPDARWVALNED